MTTQVGTFMPVSANPGIGLKTQDRIKRAKGAGVPLIPWPELETHPNGRWYVANGVVYLRGVDGLTPNTGTVWRTFVEAVDAYGVDKDGVPLAAFKKVLLEEVAAWDKMAADAEADKQIVRERTEAAHAEFLGRKNRNYSVARIAGSIFSGGVNLSKLKEYLPTLGIEVTKGKGSRILVSYPGGGKSPHVQHATKYADIAARYGALLVDDKIACDVKRCTRSGEWVTASGAVICDKHAGK